MLETRSIGLDTYAFVACDNRYIATCWFAPAHRNAISIGIGWPTPAMLGIHGQ